MKIFLDTANIQEILQWQKTGLIDGITTNPTNVAKEGGDPIQTVKKVLEVVNDNDVSIQITEHMSDKLYAQAKRIAALAKNVVVKVPCHVDYYPVIKRLVDEGVRINITLVFTVMQGLHMCKLGVAYISPFMARSDDIAMDGLLLLDELRTMVDAYGFSTKILAASIRTVADYHHAIIAGADIATLSAKVLEKAVDHPLVHAGIEQFDKDWKVLGSVPFI